MRRSIETSGMSFKLEGVVEPSRSALMRRVKAKHSKPELAVRRLAHRMGYRFRLHGKSLPGTPDLVFASRRKVIFVHGCFWHRHKGCVRCTTPKTRAAYWANKFEQNTKRDRRNIGLLRQAGWEVLVVWECLTMTCGLEESLSGFLRKADD